LEVIRLDFIFNFEPGCFIIIVVTVSATTSKAITANIVVNIATAIAATAAIG